MNLTDSDGLVSMVSTVAEKLGIELDPTIVFEHSNAADLARHLFTKFVLEPGGLIVPHRHTSCSLLPLLPAWFLYRFRHLYA